MLSVKEALFILSSRRENLNFQIYRDKHKEEENRLFSVIIAGKARNNEYKLSEEKYSLDIQEGFQVASSGIISLQYNAAFFH